MQAMELAVLDWIQLHLRCEFLDMALPAVSQLSDHGEIWILLAVLLLAFRKTRPVGAALSCALVLDLAACNMLLKPLIGRVRPFAVNQAVELLTRAPMDASFPSGHTAASMTAASALKTAGSPLWRPALVLAVVIALSRLYLYVHWPTDVLGGTILGFALGWLGAKLAEQGSALRKTA